jgi:prevent-host-death family protein
MLNIAEWYDIPYYSWNRRSAMTTLSVSEARSNLYRLIDETAMSHQPVVITGKRHNAVLVSAEDWESIQETMHLVSIPGMRESIRDGLATPVDQCVKELDW